MKQNYILSLLFILIFSQLKAQTTITFNGTDNKVSVPKNGNGVMNNFTTPHDFTIEIRFKFYGTPNGTVFSKHRLPADGFFIEMRGAKIKAGMGYNNNFCVITEGDFPTNQFYHAALSYKVSSNQFKFYVNGRLVNTQTLPSTYVPNVDDHISIGSTDYWGGFEDLAIDYFRIWDIQKSDSDIDSNKNIEVSSSSTGLLLQYRFDSGSTITDSSSNGNDGIFFGGVLSTSEIEKINTLNFFPNPSTIFIQVSGLNQTEKYRIYSIIGSEIASGEISNNEKIDIQNLTNGLYFLKLKDRSTIKFIKK